MILKAITDITDHQTICLSSLLGFIFSKKGKETCWKPVNSMHWLPRWFYWILEKKQKKLSISTKKTHMDNWLRRPKKMLPVNIFIRSQAPHQVLQGLEQKTYNRHLNIVYIYMQIHTHFPGEAGGESFGMDNFKPKKKFACRMHHGRPISSMPKPFWLVCTSLQPSSAVSVWWGGVLVASACG